MIVIGGGPAGLSATLTFLEKGWKTILVEKKFKDIIGYKPCGDALAKKAIDLLKKETGVGLFDAPGNGSIMEINNLIIQETRAKKQLEINVEGYTLDRLKQGQYMLDAAISNGLILFDGHEAIQLEQENGKITGVKIKDLRNNDF